MKAVTLAVAVALLCVVAVMAQHPRHCEAPREFEAHVLQSDFHEKFARRGHLAYDAEGERTSFYEHVENGTDHEHFHVIHLFRERRVYRLNLRTKVCTLEHSDAHFRPIGIRREAHFVGEAYIGTNAFENSGLLTTHWDHRNKTEHMEWYGVFTDREVGCVPVSDDYTDDTVGHVQTHFFDVALGISDPNVFVPDSSCPHVATPTEVAKQTAGNPRKFSHGVYHRRDMSLKPSSKWTLFKQCDPSWANNELGTCGSLTICAAGCAMSSVAMILSTRGVSTNPADLNNWLRNNGGYESGCDIVWGSVDAFGKTSFQGIEHADFATICSGISAGHGIIGNVRGGSHWVLLTGCTGSDTFYVNDPGFPQNTYTYGDVLQEAVYH